MAQQTFSVPANARILISRCSERVTVTGWDDAQHLITDSPARQDGDTFVIENVRRVMLRAPRTVSVTISDCEADVRVEDISGNVELAHIEGDVILRGLAQATLRDLEGDLSARGVATIKGEGTWEGDAALRGAVTLDVNEIQGDLALNDVGAVSIQTLEGDLAARVVRGPLRLGDVKGDISLHEVEGDVNVAHLDGDFIAAGMHGSVDAPEIDGDAVVSLVQVKDVIVRAEGDAVINFPANTNAEIELDAPHGDVVARGGFRILERDENHLRGTLGNGGSRVVIESLHDDVIARIGLEGPGAHPIGADAEFRAPFAEMGREFSQLGREMGQEFSQLGRDIGEEVRRSVHESLSGKHIHHGPHRSREEQERARAEHQRLREEHMRARAERQRAREEQLRAFQEQRRAQQEERARHGRGAPTSGESLRAEQASAPTPPPAETKPSGPPAGSPERKAILDAIARGELSVDDAIRKLNGE